MELPQYKSGKSRSHFYCGEVGLLLRNPPSQRVTLQGMNGAYDLSAARFTLMLQPMMGDSRHGQNKHNALLLTICAPICSGLSQSARQQKRPSLRHRSPPRQTRGPSSHYARASGGTAPSRAAPGSPPPLVHSRGRLPPPGGPVSCTLTTTPLPSASFNSAFSCCVISGGFRLPRCCCYESPQGCV